MAKQFRLSARNMEMRPANTGVTISVEDDDEERSGKLQIAKAGVTWTPKRAWAGGPRSIRIRWEDIPTVFRRYQEAP